jgi:hypothetical protein
MPGICASDSHGEGYELLDLHRTYWMNARKPWDLHMRSVRVRPVSNWDGAFCADLQAKRLMLASEAFQNLLSLNMILLQSGLIPVVNILDHG